MDTRTGRAGFTLTELMLVVAIITILAGIAIPKMSDLIDKSKDGQTQGNLGVLRSALAIYYVGTEGWYPAEPETDLARSLVPEYLAQIPKASPARGGHPASNEVLMIWNQLGEDDGPGWAYDWNRWDPVVQPNPNPIGLYWGHIRVRCYHRTTKGQFWKDL
jgi:prepilin-type N-terminal cleavage/methylation domain-containing protein